VFELFSTPRFIKELKKLQKEEISRISEKLELTLNEPLLFFEKLEGMALYKLRIGKFRVIAAVNFNQRKIICVSVGLRKNVYRRL